MSSISQFITALETYEGNDVYLRALQSKLANGEKLSTTQHMLGKQILFRFAAQTNNKDLIPKREIKKLDIDWTVYSRKPFQHQKEGINWLLNTPKGILADEPGLGKSLEAGLAAVIGNYKKVLIVCPAFLKLNWQTELEYFVPSKDITVIKSKNYATSKFSIINYDILKKFQDTLLKEKFDLVIADEAHLLKNMKAIRFRSFSKLATKSKNVWLLTGTPIANRPIDFYALLKICKHDLGKNKHAYGMRYCNGQANQFGGMDFTGASNLKELHFKSLDVILRRKKEEVLDLPDKVQTPILLELSSFKKYEDSIEKYYQEIYEQSLDPSSEMYGRDTSRSSILAELSCYRRFCAREKVSDGSLFELIDSQLEDYGRCVVFTGYHDISDEIKKHYKTNCETIDGRLSQEEKQKRIDLFQAGKGPNVFVCNTFIAVGITLTDSSVGIFNDLPWSPALLQQAMDRLHRISQTQKVNIFFPVYKKTIDEVMLNVLKEKIKHINEAVDGKAQSTNFSGDITKEIFTKLKALNQ